MAVCVLFNPAPLIQADDIFMVPDGDDPGPCSLQVLDVGGSNVRRTLGNWVSWKVLLSQNTWREQETGKNVHIGKYFNPKN